MKKSTSLLFSGLLLSGMVLGATTTAQTVHADSNTATEAASEVTNNVTYMSGDKKVGQKSIQGTKGSAITYVPDGYAIVGTPTMGDNAANVTVNVTKMISVKVNYVDQNGQLVNSEMVNGGDGSTYKLTDIPAGCTWNNDEEQTITLVDGKEYNIPVTRKVFNTVIFKTADNIEVGRAEVFGDKVGDSISLTTAQIPSGYTVSSNSLTLQSDNNTQVVKVTKDGETPTGVVTINDKDAKLYTVYGNVISGRTLQAGSSWKTFGTKVIKGTTYYKVATDEWVSANDVTVGDDATQETVTPFIGVVTTKNAIANLVDKNGNTLTGRGLGPNTPWKTANKMVLNNKTYYQVATNEWVDADAVTVTSQNGQSTDSGEATPFVSTVTTTGVAAPLYTADGQLITGRGLGPNTSWKTASKKTIDGETYYQVATTEWVKGSNIQ